MQKKLKKQARKIGNYFARQRRDTRYMVVGLVALIVLVLSTLQALNAGLFDSLERPIFDSINGLPRMFDGIMYAVTQMGGAGSLLLWVGLAWYLVNRRAAIMVGAAGISGWYIAKILKDIVARGRPEALLDTLNLFANKQFGGYGFPSGHSTFIAACVTVLYYQVERKYRKYLILTALLVGFSRMYLGAHFPLDVVGGWALGALVGSIVCMVFGVSIKFITIPQIKSALNKKGLPMKHVEFAKVDARGSRPVFMTDENGKKFFGKIFGAQEHAADWLFKVYRFFRYKNLQAEEPYISSRRNIELESFATLWARHAGVRVPEILDIVKIGASWMLIQEMLDSKQLSDHGNLRQTSLVDAWCQVELLHAAGIAHRDLRAANIMVDKQGQAWLIDFGFAEVSARKKRQYMDVAELLMSMSLVVGVDRTVDAAMEVVDPGKLACVLPYLKREVFSGATAKSLRQNKHLLSELSQEIKDRLAIEDEIEEADIVRINTRKAFNIAMIGVFIYVIVPQLKLFRGAMHTITQLNPWWLLPIIIASALTYVFSAAGITALSSVPLKFITTTIVQVAASFMNKILPGALGSAGLNASYLRKAGNDQADSVAIVAAHSVLGFLMFIVPMSLFLLFRGESLANVFAVHISGRSIVFIVIGVISVILALAMFRRLRRKAIKGVTDFAASIREFTNSTFEVTLACAAGLAVSLGYIACLYMCFKAFGIHLGFDDAVLVYATAIIAKTVVPTPGGLGPLEIAMVSALVAFGIVDVTAVSVVVLYRLATYWLPIPFSLLSYRYVTNKKII